MLWRFGKRLAWLLGDRGQSFQHLENLIQIVAMWIASARHRVVSPLSCKSSKLTRRNKLARITGCAMAFTDFKSADAVQRAYQIRYLEQNFLPLTPKAPPEAFVQDFEFNRENFDIFSSEASRCEAVIYPMLREVCKSFVQDYSLWSHKSISADDALSGLSTGQKA